MQKSVIVTKQRLIELADAIRVKRGIDNKLSIVDMVSEVNSIGTIPGEISRIILDCTLCFNNVEVTDIKIKL